MKKFIIFAVIACFIIGTIVYAWQITIGSQGPVIEVSTADEVICELEGNQFIKLNDGAAYVGLYRNKKGAIVPMLISEDEEAVQYLETATGKTVYANYYTYEVGDKEYYFSDGDSIERYVEGWQSYSDLPIYYTDTQHSAGTDVAKDIMKDRAADNDGGWLLHIIKNYWYWPIVIASFIFLFIKVIPYFSSGSSDDDYSYGSSGGRSSADISRTLDEIDEMRTMKHISDTINAPGYDSESFGPPSDI